MAFVLSATASAEPKFQFLPSGLAIEDIRVNGMGIVVPTLDQLRASLEGTNLTVYAPGELPDHMARSGSLYSVLEDQ